MRKFLIIILFTAILFSLFACSAKTPADTVLNFFTALNNLDFKTAGIILGDENYYESILSITENKTTENQYDKLQSMYFIDFIYGNVSCEITDSSHNAEFSLYKCKISSYNAEEVLEKVHTDATELMNTHNYLSASDEEKYNLLCEQLTSSYNEMASAIKTTETETEIKVIEKDEEYYIVPSENLLRAIGGNPD